MGSFADSLKPEDILHRDVVNAIEILLPLARVHHSPNEGKRGAFARYLYVLFKVKSGFPDLIIFYNGCIMVIELKAIGADGKIKEPTDLQMDWLNFMKDQGHYSIWSDNYEEVIFHIKRFQKWANGKESNLEKENEFKTPELRKRKEKRTQKRRMGKVIRKGRAW